MKGLRENYIGIKLTNEAGEVVVLEESRKQKPSKFGRIPDDEAGV